MATPYYFQYGDEALGANPRRVRSGAEEPCSQHRTADSHEEALHYRFVAHEPVGTTLGKRRMSTTRQSRWACPSRQQRTRSARQRTALLGRWPAPATGRKIVLQNDPWPYTGRLQDATNEQLTNAQGGFAFPLLSCRSTPSTGAVPERPGGREPDRDGG